MYIFISRCLFHGLLHKKRAVLILFLTVTTTNWVKTCYNSVKSSYTRDRFSPQVSFGCPSVARVTKTHERGKPIPSLTTFRLVVTSFHECGLTVRNASLFNRKAVITQLWSVFSLNFKMTQIGPKSDQNRTKIGPKSDQNRTKIGPKSVQNHLKIGSLSSPFQSNHFDVHIAQNRKNGFCRRMVGCRAKITSFLDSWAQIAWCGSIDCHTIKR